MFSIVDMRAQAADASTTSLARRTARAELRQVISTANGLGFLPLAYEGRLALAEIESKDDPVRAKQSLLELGREAHASGLELVARKAAAILQTKR